MDIHAFKKLSYGVYVVASGNENRKNAFIATTVFQVTSEPPKIVVACNKDNFTTNIIRELKVFSASVLKQNCSSTIIGNLGFRSGKDFDKFENYNNYCYGKNTNVPIILEDSIAWFECKLIEEVNVGTHILFVGEVLDAQITAENIEPLTYSYYSNVKKGVSSKNAPSYIENVVDKIDNANEKVCSICGYVYDSELGDVDNGIAVGTPFESLTDDWTCPVCGVGKEMFE